MNYFKCVLSTIITLFEKYLNCCGEKETDMERKWRNRREEKKEKEKERNRRKEREREREKKKNKREEMKFMWWMKNDSEIKRNTKKSRKRVNWPKSSSKFTFQMMLAWCYRRYSNIIVVITRGFQLACLLHRSLHAFWCLLKVFCTPSVPFQ